METSFKIYDDTTLIKDKQEIIKAQNNLGKTKLFKRNLINQTLFENILGKSEYVGYIKEAMPSSTSKLEENPHVNFVCDAIITHMGPWTTDYNGNEVLQKPKDKYQRFVHMCDYLASRKFLDVKFINDEIVSIERRCK